MTEFGVRFRETCQWAMPLAPAASHAAVHEGESFGVVDDHDPKSVCDQFETEQADGVSGRNNLEQGSETRRVQGGKPALVPTDLTAPACAR